MCAQFREGLGVRLGMRLACGEVISYNYHFRAHPDAKVTFLPVL